MWHGALSRLQLTILASCLVSCSPAPSISEDDVASTLKAVVEIAAKSRKLPASACISSNLELSGITISGEKVGDWTKLEGSSVAYRLLQAPKINRLPPAAAAVIPLRMRGSACNHQLMIHLPEFVQISEAGHTSTVAFVNISDHCPLCGAGYQVMFTKSGERWKVEQSDFQVTWIS